MFIQTTLFVIGLVSTALQFSLVLLVDSCFALYARSSKSSIPNKWLYNSGIVNILKLCKKSTGLGVIFLALMLVSNLLDNALQSKIKEATSRINPTRSMRIFSEGETYAFQGANRWMTNVNNATNITQAIMDSIYVPYGASESKNVEDSLYLIDSLPSKDVKMGGYISTDPLGSYSVAGFVFGIHSGIEDKWEAKERKRMPVFYGNVNYVLEGNVSEYDFFMHPRYRVHYGGKEYALELAIPPMPRDENRARHMSKSPNTIGFKTLTSDDNMLICVISDVAFEHAPRENINNTIVEKSINKTIVELYGDNHQAFDRVVKMVDSAKDDSTYMYVECVFVATRLECLTCFHDNGIFICRHHIIKCGVYENVVQKDVSDLVVPIVTKNKTQNYISDAKLVPENVALTHIFPNSLSYTKLYTRMVNATDEVLLLMVSLGYNFIRTNESTVVVYGRSDIVTGYEVPMYVIVVTAFAIIISIITFVISKFMDDVYTEPLYNIVTSSLGDSPLVVKAEISGKSVVLVHRNRKLAFMVDDEEMEPLKEA